MESILNYEEVYYYNADNEIDFDSNGLKNPNEGIAKNVLFSYTLKRMSP